MRETIGTPAWPDTSHWSVIAAVVRPDTDANRQALESFCATFRGPVLAFAQRVGFGPHEAQDLTQEFFLYVLGESRPLAGYDRDRGRFRPYFLTVLRHFLANRRRHEGAAKRGGGKPALSLDHPTLEDGAVADQAPPPEVEFTRAWAAALLARVVARLRADVARSPRAVPLESLLARLIDGRSGSYDDLAAELGTTAGALRVAAHRLRERFEAYLRDEIARTVSTPEEVDEEIRAMFAAFSSRPRV